MKTAIQLDHYSGTDDGNPVDGNLSLESRLYK